uniref:Putative lipocalin-2 1 n=1 Tax=Amblyomma cajennense TaxID=34607 RepID=A0A023FQJ8_AMBCJ
MNSFVVAMLLALGATVISAKPSKEDLYKALNTTDRIWTVRRSYERGAPNAKHSCVYAKKEDLSDDNYQFVQGFKNGSKWQNETLYGKLSDQAGEAVLTVSKIPNPGEGNGVPYTLQYWEKENHCGVLTFTGIKDRELKCELHVWEQKLSPATNWLRCELAYETICTNMHKFPVYTDDCLREVVRN